MQPVECGPRFPRYLCLSSGVELTPASVHPGMPSARTHKTLETSFKGTTPATTAICTVCCVMVVHAPPRAQRCATMEPGPDVCMADGKAGPLPSMAWARPTQHLVPFTSLHSEPSSHAVSSSASLHLWLDATWGQLVITPRR